MNDPCVHCKKPSMYSDLTLPICENCWEVYGRLNEFLRSEKNRAAVIVQLQDKYPEFMEKACDRS